jgi:GGDEF domain-containing protein
MEALDAEFKRAKALHTDFCVLFFDLDKFKNVNDTYGHDAGDYVLKEFAQLVRASHLRPKDVFARYGGEEFIVLLSNTNLKDATDIAERIRGGELSALNPAVFEVAKELAELPAEWASFRSQIRGFLQPLYLNGQLKTAADLAILLEEAAVGLSAAEKVADNPK